MSLGRFRGGLLEAQVRDNTDRLFASAPVDIDCSEATNTCWVVSQNHVWSALAID